MRTVDKIAGVILVVSGLTLLSHGADALMAQTERPATEYDTVSRVVLPGQSLWDICSKLDTSEDIREVIDRARTDNDVTDPGALQPGKVLQIRVKR
ncbi:LysM peptidoglycan-binding domain-containing protein [uncultured Acidaminococcus sp.]|uniref:LysM peptidoglycan-binding domain-containing protein n=1 Tax=uncultured Acidaminococcus sp. TaxID=352152 RepID=UPI0026DA828F|nr:LysM peptidoglycan-binding domain-containing protein [uncultured Acidaminococcus sp.]